MNNKTNAVVGAITKKVLLRELNEIANKIDDLKRITGNDYHYWELEDAHENIIKAMQAISEISE